VNTDSFKHKLDKVWPVWRIWNC